VNIPKIEHSSWNHGSRPELICTITTSHEIAFTPDDIVRVLITAASDDMAKVINSIGAIFNLDQFAEACAVDDLNPQGRELIDSLHFFMHAQDEREVDV